MSKKPKHHSKLHHAANTVLNFWKKQSRWVKWPTYLFLVLAFVAVCLWGVSLWYAHKHRNEPLVLGTTFIPSYARYYDQDPKETLESILTDLNMKHLRLVSYWDEMEPEPGKYDFSELDWQFKMAEEHNAKVTLSLGLRQPRWPECHAPTWVENQPQSYWLPKLNEFMGQVIERYKDNPQLESYQLENEYFLGAFGECRSYGADRERLISEYKYVKSQDDTHPVILSLANNYFGLPTGQPRPDVFGVSVYKRVYDYTVTKDYFEYPFPPWYYGARSGLTEIVTGKPSMLHELQAEPWGPTGVKEMSFAEQDVSMNAESLKNRIKYGTDAGYRTIDLWGAEWWLWRKQNGDPSLWNVAKQAVADSNER